MTTKSGQDELCPFCKRKLEIHEKVEQSYHKFVVYHCKTCKIFLRDLRDGIDA